MKVIFLSVISLLLCFTIFAQDFSVEKLSEASPVNPDEVYTFPLLKGGDNEICEKINKYLVEDQLFITYGEEKTSIFENVWETDDQPAMLFSLTYETELLNEKLYSVTISGEFCGAYCEGYDMTFTFDLKTGELITLNRLFTNEGLEGIVEAMVKNKKEKIAAKINEVNAMLSADTLEEGMQEYYTEMRDMYESCESIETVESLQYIRFIPAENSLIVVYGRCSAHYNMAMDELWYFELELPFEQWSGLFSDYALGLF